MAKLDEKQWSALRAEYISTNISLRKLAKKYGLSEGIMMKRSRYDGWADKRVQFRRRTEAKIADKLIDREAADAALKLIALKESADAMAGVIAKTMQDADQFNRHIVTEYIGGGETQTECRVMEKVDTRAIKDLTGAIKDLTQIMRNLYDLPTIQEKAAMQIAAKRLQLDEKAADKAEASGEGIVVKFDDGIGDLSE